MELFRTSLGYIQTQFEPQTWQAFWRTTVDGISSTLVAVELGMTAAAVRKCRSRVTNRIRQDLAELIG